MDNISDFLLSHGYSIIGDCFVKTDGTETTTIQPSDYAGLSLSSFKQVAEKKGWLKDEKLFGWISNDLKDVPLPFPLAAPYNIRVTYSRPFIHIQADHDDPDVTLPCINAWASQLVMIHCELYEGVSVFPTQRLYIYPNNFKITVNSRVGYFQPPKSGLYQISCFAKKGTVESARHVSIVNI